MRNDGSYIHTVTLSNPSQLSHILWNFLNWFNLHKRKWHVVTNIGNVSKDTESNCKFKFNVHCIDAHVMLFIFSKLVLAVFLFLFRITFNTIVWSNWKLPFNKSHNLHSWIVFWEKFKKKGQKFGKPMHTYSSSYFSYCLNFFPFLNLNFINSRSFYEFATILRFRWV